MHLQLSYVYIGYTLELSGFLNKLSDTDRHTERHTYRERERERERERKREREEREKYVPYSSTIFAVN